jgi:hypothetical protein
MDQRRNQPSSKRPEADPDGMIRRMLEGFRFLGDLTATEKALPVDVERKKREEARALIAFLSPT